MSFDAIVLGLGSFGSATVRVLARRGVRVCGIDQFGPAHALGSSHGESRLTRTAYFKHLDYVPLVRRASALWREIEETSGQDLLRTPGVLLLGDPASLFIRELAKCYTAHPELRHDRWTASEVARRFPQFAAPNDTVAYFDYEGGYLRPERCVRACLDDAARGGATLHFNERVLAWRASGSGVEVRTNLRTVTGGKLLICAGAFASAETMRLPFGIRPVRKVLYWYRVYRPESFVSPAFPCWIAKFGTDEFYGFPSLEPGIIKVAESEEPDGGGAVSPWDVERRLLPGDETRIRAFLDRFLPGAVLERSAHAVCLYERTPDGHFIIDRHPDYAQVGLMVGGSGHGFKFSSVIGELGADFGTKGDFGLVTDIFRTDRPALQK